MGGFLGSMTPHNHEIVDYRACCEVTFLCIFARICLGTFWTLSNPEKLLFEDQTFRFLNLIAREGSGKIFAARRLLWFWQQFLLY
jgi:hypothetical protein